MKTAFCALFLCLFTSIALGRTIQAGDVLEIYVKGEKIPLESDIGRKNSEQPIHTHDEDFLDGVIHLEFNGRVTPDQVLLGRFFDIWEKKFDWSEGKVIMTVNGEENTELKNYVMRHEDEIVLKFE